MIESLGFLVFVVAVYYVLWWSFRVDDGPKLVAVEKAEKIRREIGRASKTDKEIDPAD